MEVPPPSRLDAGLVEYTPQSFHSSEVMVGDKRRFLMQSALEQFVFEVLTMGWVWLDSSCSLKH